MGQRFCFEICAPEGRGDEKGGGANFKTNHTEPYMPEYPALVYLLATLVNCYNSCIINGPHPPILEEGCCRQRLLNRTPVDSTYTDELHGTKSQTKTSGVPEQAIGQAMLIYTT